MFCLTVTPPSAEALGQAEAAAEAVDRLPMPEVDLRDAKPGWAKTAVRKGVFAPEYFKAGIRRVPHTPKGQGRRKPFAAT